MANIAEITTDYDGTLNADITEAPGGNSIYTSITGTAASTAAKYLNTWVKQGTTAMRVDVTNQTKILRADFTASATVWSDFYLKIDKVPASAMIIHGWYSASTLIGSMRVVPVVGNTAQFTLQLRNGSSAISGTDQTGVLNVGEAYRVAVKCKTQTNVSGDGNGFVLKVFSGANIDTMTPTYSINGASTVVAATIDNIRHGAISTDTTGLTIWYDDMVSDNSTQPTRSAAPSGPIPEWTEGFEGGNVGTDVSANSVITGVVAGGTTILYYADPYANTKCARFNGTAQYAAYRMTKSSETGNTYFKFGLKVSTVPDVSTGILSALNGTTKVMDIRVSPVNATTFTLQLRDSNNSTNTLRWESSNITYGSYIEVAVRISPNATSPGVGTMSLRYYAGANRGGATATQDSGSQAMTLSTQTAITELRFGSINSATADLRFDVFRASRDAEPAGLQPPGSPLSVTATGAADLEPYSTFNLASSISGGLPPYTYSWTQTAGSPSTALTGSTTATPSGTAPATLNGTTLTYQVSVTDSTSPTPQNATASVNVTVLPHIMWSRSGSSWVAIREWSRDVSSWV